MGEKTTSVRFFDCYAKLGKFLIHSRAQKCFTSKKHLGIIASDAPCPRKQYTPPNIWLRMRSTVNQRAFDDDHIGEIKSLPCNPAKCRSSCSFFFSSVGAVVLHLTHSQHSSSEFRLLIFELGDHGF
ncbi:hypothetical protein TNCV_3015291 [Trichonephila clavipes]|nr:hypothetical protein TNCV_3015291 [Trichonephila clavipes]